MKAWVLSDEPSTGVVCAELPVPRPAARQVRIRVRAAGLNHRDLWCVQRKYPGVQLDTPLGSDGWGVVDACGVDTPTTWQGQAVLMNPNIDWGKDSAAQGAGYQILGMPTSGTFAEYVCVGSDRLHRKPSYLTTAEAAALPLATLTAYRALFRKGGLLADKANGGEKPQLLIKGIGGGVALVALRLAVAVGVRVWVTSASESKIKAACALGAVGGFQYTDPDWEAQAAHAFGARGLDVVLDSAGGEAVNTYLGLLRPGGRLVVYGATAGLAQGLDLRRLFWKQLTIHGSTMGNDEEFVHALRFAETHRLRPVVDAEFDFDALPAAFSRMQEAAQFGKLVLKVSEDT